MIGRINHGYLIDSGIERLVTSNELSKKLKPLLGEKIPPAFVYEDGTEAYNLEDLTEYLPKKMQLNSSGSYNGEYYISIDRVKRKWFVGYERGGGSAMVAISSNRYLHEALGETALKLMSLDKRAIDE